MNAATRAFRMQLKSGAVAEYKRPLQQVFHFA